MKQDFADESQLPAELGFKNVALCKRNHQFSAASRKRENQTKTQHKSQKRGGAGRWIVVVCPQTGLQFQQPNCLSVCGHPVGSGRFG